MSTPQPRADAEREAFEADAEALGFDIARDDGAEAAEIEPWMHYNDIATGHRYAGWLAGRAQALAEVAAAPAVAWRYEARHIDTAWGAAVSFADPGPEGVYMRNVTPLIARPQPDAPEGGEK